MIDNRVVPQSFSNCYKVTELMEGVLGEVQEHTQCGLRFWDELWDMKDFLLHVVEIHS